MLKNFLIVAVGGGLGSIMRFGISLLFKPAAFPFPILVVNIIGSLVIGIVMGLSIKDANFSAGKQLFFATGICGGFTTFSAFSIENIYLLQNEKYFLAVLYTGLSVILGIAAAWLGYKLAAS